MPTNPNQPDFGSQYTPMPEPQFNPIPDPSQNNQGYNYTQTQQIMNQQQTNLQAAINTATNNAQAQMQSVVAGTMAAAMAVYHGGKSITDKAHERVYQDMLMSGGNYVLERNAWRDTMWGMGVSSSDFGRAMKIGGRRPEFLSSEEYGYQRERSWGYRKEELTDMMYSGGASVLGSAVGYGIGMIPGVGPIAGMAASYLIDETIGKAISPLIDYRRAGREMRQYGETTNFNFGGGQRRMSGATADRLGREYLKEERNVFDYIPFTEGLAERLRPELAPKKVMQSMGQMGLLRDINPDDIDALKTRVSETTTIIDKYAGLLHATRDGILHLKATFDQLGLNNTQQNVAIGKVASTALSTGMPLEYLTQQYGNFVQTGMQTGFFNASTPGIQGSVGLTEIARIKAGQENGSISRIYDPGTLAQQNFVNAAAQTRTGYGLVTQYGHGNTTLAAGALRKMGGGSIALGLQLQDTDYGNQGDPIAIHSEMVNNVFTKLGGEKNFGNALAGALSMETTREGKNQAYRDIMGITSINEYQRKLSGWNTYYTERGLGSDKGFARTYNLAGIGIHGTMISDSKSNTIRSLGDYVTDISGKMIDKDSGALYDKFNKAKDDSFLKQKVAQYRDDAIAGRDFAGKDAAVNHIMETYGTNKEDASQIFDSMNSNFDRDRATVSVAGRLANGLEGAIDWTTGATAYVWGGKGTSFARDYRENTAIKKLEFEKSHSVMGFLDEKEKRISDLNVDHELYNFVTRKMSDGKAGEVILKAISEANGDKTKTIGILKRYGIDVRGDSVHNEDQKYNSAMMAVKDWGRGKIGGTTNNAWEVTSKNIAGAGQAYLSMTKDKEGQKVLAKHGITNEMDFYTANTKLASALGNARHAIQGGESRLSQEQLKAITDNSDLLLNQDFGRQLKLANKEGGEALSTILNKMASAESGGAIGEGPGGTAGTDQSANLDAINKLAAACDKLASALAK